MDAKTIRAGVLFTLVLLFQFIPSSVFGASYKTTNFVVTAPTAEIAEKVGQCAEFWRRDLAVQWLGRPLKNWYRPCPISVKVGQIGAGGATTFTFDNGEVFGWKMNVQGSLERILDSVIPHEVNHTIFASYFRRPLPRWADEGAATLFEHESERKRQTRLLEEVMNTSRRIPLKTLLTIREYPQDMQDVLTLYAEGYSLAEYLVDGKGNEGRRIYLQFLADAHQQGWNKAIRKHYGFENIEALEAKWNEWVLAGSPSLLPEGQMLAQHDSQAEPPADEPAAKHDSTDLALTNATEYVIRSQSPAESESHPQPLARIDRQLRSEAETFRHSGNVADASDAPQAQPVEGISRELSSDFRSRSGEQPKSRPSLPPHSLSPTADGIYVNKDASHYNFPKARR